MAVESVVYRQRLSIACSTSSDGGSAVLAIPAHSPSSGLSVTASVLAPIEHRSDAVLLLIAAAQVIGASGLSSLRMERKLLRIARIPGARRWEVVDSAETSMQNLFL